MFRYFAFNKPFGLLSQFTSEAGHPGLGSLKLDLPRDVYPVGRLDRDSEGLLLLTNDMGYRHSLTDPTKHCKKRYWVQVEGEPTNQDLVRLEKPMTLRIKGKEYRTQGADVSSIPALTVWDREPPIRERKHIPTQWIQMEISEGKNRQIRRMTAQVGFPTLRLIRAGVGGLSLLELDVAPGCVKELTWESASRALR